MAEKNNRYFIINKPLNMVSQFISSHDVGLLGNLNYNFPEGIHAIGRLDSNSEGLLILTTNKKITRLLFQSKIPHKRVYLVQVRNIVSYESLKNLQNGVTFRVKNGIDYTTSPCDVSIVSNPEEIVAQAVSLPSYIPATWLKITLTEGKFHQVRKMVNAVNHRCKRLIRIAIEDLALEDLKPGCVKEIEEKEFFKKLNLEF